MKSAKKRLEETLFGEEKERSLSILKEAVERFEKETYLKKPYIIEARKKWILITDVWVMLKNHFGNWDVRHEVSDHLEQSSKDKEMEK